MVLVTNCFLDSIFFLYLNDILISYFSITNVLFVVVYDVNKCLLLLSRYNTKGSILVNTYCHFGSKQILSHFQETCAKIFANI